MSNTSKRQYKINLAYITSDGSRIEAGIYEEGTFDLAEARKKSIVTLLDVNIPIKVSQADTMDVQKFNDDSTELSPVTVEAKLQTVKHETLKINSEASSTIEKLKYVSKKNADDVVKQREIKRFESYNDLNNRVPLKFNRSWEDIVAIDFEEIVEHSTENAIYYSEGVHPLNNLG